MKIVSIVRTRDEARNIWPFIESYKGWVDSILVADGGSEDDTLSMLRQLAALAPVGFLQVRPFPKRALNAGYWWNPEGQHINFLIDWAKEEGADWVIFDDCDCRPNAALRRDARKLIEGCESQIVRAVRLYWWGTGEHFPDLAQPGTPGTWQPSLWAWRVDTGLHCVESKDWGFSFEPAIDSLTHCDVVPPNYCLNHHGWPDQETANRKMAQHQLASRSGHLFQSPLAWAGRLEPVPDWASEV